MAHDPTDRSSQDLPADQFSQNTAILHYRIIRLIGRGAMGDVYLAEDTRLERAVALKFLPDWLSEDTAARQRLIEEARAASRLNHPNITAVYSLEEFKGRHFIVMEYVEGIPLKEMAKAEQITLKLLVNLAIDICKGLEAAHSLGIIHRDIKPQNILIDKNGRAKICDFGIALHKDRTQKTGTVLAGTAAYMSPEQAQGAEADQRSDIFSLGSMLYEMATGKQAFAGEYEAALLYSVINESPMPLSKLRPDLPITFQNIVDRAMRKNPLDRYQNTTDMICELKELLKPAGIQKRIFPVRPILLVSGLLILMLVTLWILRSNYLTGGKKIPALAVLPFENLGKAEDQYIADGMTDAITTELAKLRNLRVISRTSAQQIAKRNLTIPEIGRRLNVDYVLEGTIHLDYSGPKTKVRINPQFIKSFDDNHLWVETYEGTVDSLFHLQAEIAQNVARELNIRISTAEKKLLGAEPTANTRAYDYYLKGIYYLHRTWRAQDRIIAAQMFEKAIDLDPKFALAYAMLSQTHSVMYWEYNDRSEKRLAMARNAVNAALNLNPRLPEAHTALGTYYYSKMDFDSALVQYRIADKSQPHNAEILGALAGLYRHKGDINKASSYYEEAFGNDPLSQLRAFDVGYTYGMLRNYAVSEDYLERAISLAPDWPLPYIYKAWTAIFWKGDKQQARETLAAAYDITDLSKTEYYEYYWWLLRIIDLDYNQTLSRIVIGSDSASYYLAKGRIYHLTNDLACEQAYFDSARIVLEPMAQAQPADPRFHSQLGLAYAGLHQTEQAIAEGKKSIEILSFDRDAYQGQFMVAGLAEIYVMTGKYDEALKQIKSLLAHPGFTSIPYLKADPIWAPLWELPSFKHLE